MEAIDEVVRRVKEAHPTAGRIMWITLREEPIVYVNSEPYCLRRERFSLRNMKGACYKLIKYEISHAFSPQDYGGISASRLEVLEERLRDDVSRWSSLIKFTFSNVHLVAELNAFGGRYTRSRVSRGYTTNYVSGCFSTPKQAMAQ